MKNNNNNKVSNNITNKILIVDDEELLTNLQKTLLILKIGNIDVDIVNTLNKINDIINGNHEIKLNDYDIIILDYHMDGVEMDDFINDMILKNKYLILTSGDCQFCNKIKNVIELNYNDDKNGENENKKNTIVLTKPFDINILCECVRELINKIRNDKNKNEK